MSGQRVSEGRNTVGVEGAAGGGGGDPFALDAGVLGKPLLTQRLSLIPLRVADAVDLAPVLADARLYEYTGGDPPDLATLTARFEMLVARSSPDGRELWLNWTLRLRATNVAIGYTQATVRTGCIATIAYVVATDWQGAGLASEAVRATVDALRGAGVREIRATIPVGHSASGRVAASAGLRRNGDWTSDGEEIWVLAGWESQEIGS